MSDTPPGWYPAPHANSELRYWDGRAWLETPQAPTVAYSPAPQDAPAPQGAPLRPASGAAVAKGLALSALIVGIIAFLTGLVPVLGLILALAALGLGIFALVKRQPKGLAITGTVLGGVALLAGLVSTAALAGMSQRSQPVAVQESTPRPSATPTATPTAAAMTPTPTETASATPVAPSPAAADGSVARPYPQPYIAKGIFGGEKYQLTGRVWDANATAAVQDWNMFNDPPPAGFKYVVVELTMTGIDKDGVEPSLADFDLFLATAEGNRYSNEFIVLGDGMPSMSDGPTLYPGSTFTGYTAYVVPESAQSFLLYDNRNYIAIQ